MSQYKTGSVTVTYNSTTVTGAGVAWVTGGVLAGHTFKVKGENAEYTIASTPSSETQITLTSVYAGSGQSGAEYQITKDFTSNLEMPEIWAGDIDWPWHVTQALRTADTALADRKYQESNNGTTTTTTADVTMISYHTIQQNYAGFLEVEVVGRCTGGAGGNSGKMGAYKLMTGVVRSSGAVSLVGSLSKTAFEDVAGWDVTLGVITDQVQIKVTGGATDNISWVSSSRLLKVSS
jgi:hypothetical protein